MFPFDLDLDLDLGASVLVAYLARARYVTLRSPVTLSLFFLFFIVVFHFGEKYLF